MAALPLLQTPAGGEGAMGQHMGSGPGAMGWWMEWGFWLPVLVAAAIAALVALLLLRRPRPPPAPAANPTEGSAGAVLEALPEAEAAVLRPVLDSPGISQPEVVHRSGYSKAKVSQVLAALERRGLVYRVKEGKLYRVHPVRTLERRPAKEGQVNGPERK